MSDGPFRNAVLSSRWKRYGQDLVSDAVNMAERVVQACHSMMGDIDTKMFRALFDELKGYTERAQMSLDPQAEVQTIFDKHPVQPMTAILQRNLMASLWAQTPPGDALDQAAQATTKEWIGITKNRLDEECIRARECGDMSRKDYQKGIDRNQLAFGAINSSMVWDALVTGNKKIFHQSARKKDGLDEGPDE